MALRGASSEGRRGFSLLELLVVLSLVGIMVAVALPRLGEMVMPDPLTGAAARIIEVIGGARNTALQTGRAQFLYVDSGSGRVWFEAEASDIKKKQSRSPVFALPDRVRLRSVLVDGKIAAGSGPMRLWVSRHGLLRPLLLDLVDQSGRALRLTVHPLFPKVEMMSLDQNAVSREILVSPELGRES